MYFCRVRYRRRSNSITILSTLVVSDERVPNGRFQSRKRKVAVAAAQQRHWKSKSVLLGAKHGINAAVHKEIPSVIPRSSVTDGARHTWRTNEHETRHVRTWFRLSAAASSTIAPPCRPIVLLSRSASCSSLATLSNASPTESSRVDPNKRKLSYAVTRTMSEWPPDTTRLRKGYLGRASVAPPTRAGADAVRFCSTSPDARSPPSSSLATKACA